MQSESLAVVFVSQQAVAVCLSVALAFAQAPTPAPQSTPPAGTNAPGAVESEEGRIAEIRIISETGEILEENPSSLPLRPGQPLRTDQVRESLRLLHRTGRFADVRAETSPVPAGLRLDFVVRENFFVNLVRVVGLREPPSEAVALASLRLGLGEVFEATVLDQALEHLQQALREDGFYQARLRYETTPHADTRQMDITIYVETGPRARVGAIALRNDSQFKDAELLRRTKLKTGQEVTKGRLDRATERLRKFLVQNERLGARVALHLGEYEPAAKHLPVTLDVAAGPRTRVELIGVKISRKQLRKLLPIYQEGSVDQDLLQEGRRAIRDYLEREGYFDSQVEFSFSPAPPGSAMRATSQLEDVITYRVKRGAQHRLLGVAFDGNKYFGSELLRSRLHLQTSTFSARGRFSRRLVQEDENSIRDLYLANGFRQAQVRSEVLDDYQRKEGDLFVRFHIVEGPQTLVAELRLEGNHALNDSALLSVIGTNVGQPYSEFNVAGDRDNVLALYYNEGFPEATFSAYVEEQTAEAASAGSNVAASRVLLRYRIVEGPQVTVKRVLSGGYQHTRRRIVEREIQVKAGGPLREGEVVESQRRLYNLGIFNRVSIAPQNPSGADHDKTVVALVEEGKRYTLGYGGGFEVQRLGDTNTSNPNPASSPTGRFRASPRAILEISKANFTGRADTLSFKARASTLQYRGLLSYTASNVFNRPAFSFQLTGLADKSRDVLTFTSTRYEGTAQLAQRFSQTTSLLYRYSFRQVRASDLNIQENQIPLFNQPTLVSLFGATWVRERRDNPADATRGSFNNADLSVAGKPIGSSASFVRFLSQNSTYHLVRKGLVFARSVRFGVQAPIGNTLATDIPLPERFFAGGGNSLRGFGLNQAGPRDPTTGFPVGGEALLVLNQELRFPMRLPFLGNRVGGTIFYDAGNVFTSFRRITLRSTPPEDNLNYFSHTLGVGFRYSTPIGPVRLDLGYQLNPARFSFCIPVSVNQVACSAGNQVNRLPGFQFFFNLGSIF